MVYFLGGVMRLTDKLVKDILNSQIQYYLKHNHQYADLRALILAMKPAQSIIKRVDAQLQHSAQQDQSEAVDLLTHEVHQLQIDQDNKQYAHDHNQALIYDQESAQLEHTLVSLNRQLSAAQAASGVHKENYQRLNAEYNEANHQHPSERKRYNAKQKEYERFTQLDLEKSRLEPQISKIRADLDVLKNKKELLDINRIARHTRSVVRESYRGTLVREALSAENAKQLDQDIKKNHDDVQKKLNKLIKQAEDRCYSELMQQIECQMAELKLTDSEKNAVLLIIKQIKIHQRDLEIQQAQVDKLKQLENSLRSMQRELTDKQTRMSQNKAKNQRLNRSNKALDTKSSKISKDLQELLKQRSLLAFYSFMSIGVVGAVGLSAFLLVQFGVIAFIPPIAIVIAAVINIGVLALIFRAIIVGIQASSQQSELIKCRQTIDEQQIEIVENEETSCEFVNQDIPTLKRNIENLERQCQEQTKLKQEAEDTARVSFEKACVIQVSQPGNRFFPPAGTTQTEAVHRDGLAYNP